MPIDPISYIMPVLLIIWNAFLLAVPAFVFVCIGNWLRKRIGAGKGRAGKSAKQLKPFSMPTFIATYAVVFIVLLIIYALPFASAWQAADFSTTPEELQPSNEEWSAFIGLQAIRLALVSLAFSLMLLPFEFAGLWVYEQLCLERKINVHLSAFASCFAMCVAALIILLALPWILPGLIYLVYFA